MTNIPLFSSPDQHSSWVLTLAFSWLLQTTLVTGCGLAAAKLLRRRSAALQSAILRTTLLATLVCPIASCFMTAVGIPGFQIDLMSDNQQPPTPTILAVSPRTEVPLAANPSLTAPAIDSLPAVETISIHLPVSPAPVITEDAPAKTPALAFLDSPRQGFDTPTLVSVAERPTDHSVWRNPAQAILLAWSLTTCILLMRFIAANLVMWRLRNESGPASTEVRRECQSIATQMGITAPPVLINASFSSPCLMGLWRPAIMLPAQLHPLSPHVLAHELAHLKRQDCAWSLISRLITALIPWQPFAWWLSRRMEQAADEVCDDYVVAHNFDRVSYARELLAIAERFPASWSVTTAAVGIADCKSCLGKRVQRLLDNSRAISITAGSRPLSVTIVVATSMTLLTGLLGATNSGLQPRLDDVEVVSDEPAAPIEQDSNVPPELIVVTGSVTKPDGTPAAAATVRALHRISDELRSLLPADFKSPLYETQTDAEGHFSLSVNRDAVTDNRIPLKQRNQFGNSLQFAATLNGFGATWKEISNIEPGEELSLMLVDEIPLRGQILDSTGAPVVGARINMNRLHDIPAFTSLTTWWATAEYYELPYIEIHPRRPRSASARLLNMQAPIISDANGWIHIRGLGADRAAELTLNGENIAFHNFVAMPRDVSSEVQSDLTRRMHTPVHGQGFRLSTSAGHSLEGIIVDSITSEPLAGVEVEYRTSNHATQNASRPTPSVKSDKAGHFRLMGLPELPGAQLCIRPKQPYPYLPRRITISDFEKPYSSPMRIELHQGIWISGRVTNKLTHEPVAGITTHYLPFEDNPFADSLPEFVGDEPPDLILEQSLTDFEGRYRMVGLPGPAVIGVNKERTDYFTGVGFIGIRQQRGGTQQLLKTWPNPKRPSREWPLSMREINPPHTAQHVEVNLELDPGLRFTLRLIDEAGQPVNGVTISGLNETLTSKGDSVRTIERIAPGTDLNLIIQHRERSLGAVAQIRPSKSLNEMTIHLLPLATITGRLLKDESPMPHLTIRAYLISKDMQTRLLPTTFMTDRDGRFRCELVPANNYHFLAEGPGIVWSFATVANNVTATREPQDLGELKLGSYRKFEQASAAAPVNDVARDIPASYNFEGQVLNPVGRPAANARIFISSTRRFAAETDQLDLHAITDENGRFQFTLPTSDNDHAYETAELTAAVKGVGYVTIPAIAFETTGRLKTKLSDRIRTSLEKRFPTTPRTLQIRMNEFPVDRSFMKRQEFDLEP